MPTGKLCTLRLLYIVVSYLQYFKFMGCYLRGRGTRMCFLCLTNVQYKRFDFNNNSFYGAIFKVRGLIH